MTKTPLPFEQAILAHLDPLFGTACRLTKNPSEAEDLVQDTVIRAIRAKDQFAEGTNLKAWLFRILTNTFINQYRRGGLERSVFEGPDADPLSFGWVSASSMQKLHDPETEALRPLVEAEVGRALDALPADFRLAVVLCDVEEFTYEECAEIMGCPVGTVMSRLHRGRKLLKASLFEHAVSLGIIPDRKPENVAPQPAEHSLVNLSAYRQKRTANG